MVNMMMIKLMNKSQFIVNNQRWAGDRLAVFVRAILKECSCSMISTVVGTGVGTKEIS